MPQNTLTDTEPTYSTAQIIAGAIIGAALVGTIAMMLLSLHDHGLLGR